MKYSVLIALLFCSLGMSQFARAAEEGTEEPFAGSAFPNKDFPLHGGPAIGTKNENKAGALEESLSDTSFGNWLKSERLHLTGWFVGGANGSTATQSNQPMGYSVFPNRIDLNEAVFRIVKNVNTVQKDHADWGIHIDALYGIDYYMFISKGLFSDQILVKNNQYGYDLTQVYGDLYLPSVGDGMNIRVGRILTNPTVYMNRSFFFTHTVFDNNTGDTQTGVVDTLKLSDNWTVQAGVVNTADVALWNHTDSKVSGFGAIQWTSNTANDSVYLMAYGINDGNYAYHNWQTYYAIWTHKFTNKFFSRLQNAYFYENNVPATGAGNGTVAVGTFGKAKTGKASGYSFVETLGYSFTDVDYAAIRYELTADPQGTLTNTAAYYNTFTLGWGHSFNNWLSSTLDIRGDHSSNPAYDNQQLNHLFMVATSLSVHF